jgi:hypothetical protein
MTDFTLLKNGKVIKQTWDWPSVSRRPFEVVEFD